MRWLSIAPIVVACALVALASAAREPVTDPEAQAAYSRAVDALLECVRGYADEYAGAIASASEIADASVTHCSLALQAIDIAVRESVIPRRRSWIGRLIKGDAEPKRSPQDVAQVEQVRARAHADAARTARAVALERIIQDRNAPPAKEAASPDKAILN